VQSTGPPGWGLGVGLTTPPHKKPFVMKPHMKECWMELQKRPGRVRRKSDMFIGTWNVQKHWKEILEEEGGRV
jgi:hypothetical protein